MVSTWHANEHSTLESQLSLESQGGVFFHRYLVTQTI